MRHTGRFWFEDREFSRMVCTRHCSSRLRSYKKITSPNDNGQCPMIGGDHIRAGDLPHVSTVIAEEPEDSGQHTRNITMAGLLND